MTNSENRQVMAEASTFGPLQVIERDFGGVEAFLVPAGGDLSDDIGSLLIDRDDHTPEQMRAWARLFAAAPDLLKASRELFAALGAPSNHMHIEDARFAVLAAIKKAEGRS